MPLRYYFFLLFADDSNVFLSVKNITVASCKLSPNIDKTLFNLKKKILCTINLFINDIHIKRVTSTKFLGIIIDEKLACRPHIQQVKTKF